MNHKKKERDYERLQYSYKRRERGIDTKSERLLISLRANHKYIVVERQGED